MNKRGRERKRKRNKKKRRNRRDRKRRKRSKKRWYRRRRPRRKRKSNGSNNEVKKQHRICASEVTGPMIHRHAVKGEVVVTQDKQCDDYVICQPARNTPSLPPSPSPSFSDGVKRIIKNV